MEFREVEKYIQYNRKNVCISQPLIFLGLADLCLVFIQRLSKLTQLIQDHSVHQQQNLKRKPKSYDYSTVTEILHVILSYI